MEIKFNTGNAAFHGDYYGDDDLDTYFLSVEVERILNKIVDNIRCGKTDGAIIDINGNKCGTWTL